MLGVTLRSLCAAASARGTARIAGLGTGPVRALATGAAPLVVLDGSTGRQLQKIGAPFRQPEWSALTLIEAPEFARTVHRSYVDAGVDVVTTNSYAVVPFHLGEERFAEMGRDLLGVAGRMAREAVAGSAAKVAGSIPPVCGSYEAHAWSAEAAVPIYDIFIDELGKHADIFLGETLASVAEAACLAGTVRARRPDVPLWLSFTLDDDNAGRLRSGEQVAEIFAREETVRGVSAILFNCSRPEVMDEAIRAAAGLTDIPLGVYPNAFVYVTENESAANTVLHEMRAITQDDFRQFARQWRASGASIIGGCCGIGPEHLEGLRGALH